MQLLISPSRHGQRGRGLVAASPGAVTLTLVLLVLLPAGSLGQIVLASSNPSGACAVTTDGCLATRGGNYGNNERCLAIVTGDGHLRIDSFAVEDAVSMYPSPGPHCAGVLVNVNVLILFLVLLFFFLFSAFPVVL